MTLKKMNLVIDYGNSSAKVGIFENDKLMEKMIFAEESSLKKFLENFSAESFIISSVNAHAQEVSAWVKAKNKFILTPNLPLPILNQYATPQTLGVDRIAAVCGAHQLFPKKNCLVIDAGTCITYELLDAEGQYHGGGISPGLSMRFEAMHAFTARLPLIEPADNPPLIGNSTETCMQSGVAFGLLGEVEGIIRRYSDKFTDLKVILCGGDTRFFENKLKGSIFAVPELVLSGLNSILIHNVNR